MIELLVTALISKWQSPLNDFLMMSSGFGRVASEGVSDTGGCLRYVLTSVRLSYFRDKESSVGCFRALTTWDFNNSETLKLNLTEGCHMMAPLTCYIRKTARG